jgi:hypothetical protein
LSKLARIDGSSHGHAGRQGSPKDELAALLNPLPIAHVVDVVRALNCDVKMRGVFTVVIGASCLVSGCSRAPEAEFVTSVPWGVVGPTVVLDSHTHTRFSDGALTVPDVVSLAVRNGCDALAITDHGDLQATAVSPEYFAQVDAARREFPDLVLFAGMEWNIPPYRGREHVNILLDPSLERTVLPGFKARFETGEASAVTALQWLEQQLSERDRAALIYSHPSRLDLDPEENDRDYTDWNEAGGLFIGFEGGPGYQKAASPGDYRGRMRTEARWDPVAAQVGGTWDRLLDAGYNVWAALAVSDYHNDARDYPPCAFARTHVRVPQRDQRGVLLALRAGSFWADHSGILSRFDFVVFHPDLVVPATPGEVIRAAPSARLALRVKIKRGPGAEGLPVTIELIGNGVTGKPERVAFRELSAAEDTFDWRLERLHAGKDQQSAYFRARVVVRKSPDATLTAYGNPIRIVLGR